MATIPKAFLVLSSSPWSTQDFHAHEFDKGPTERQMVSQAPTHVANPSPEVAESETRAAEPDEVAWLREYGAVPTAGLSDNWFGSATAFALTDEYPPQHYGTRYHIAIDPAFVRDRFGWAVVASHSVDGKRVTWVHACDSWAPGAAPSVYAGKIKSLLCDVYKTNIVYSDQFEGRSFSELCQAEGISLSVVDWTAGAGPKSKTGRFKSVRTAMLEGTFKIHRNGPLEKELSEVCGIMSDGGNERIEVKRDSSGHGDRVLAMVLAGSIALEYAPQDIGRAPFRPGTPEYEAYEQAQFRNAAIKQVKENRKKETLREALGLARK